MLSSGHLRAEVKSICQKLYVETVYLLIVT